MNEGLQKKGGENQIHSYDSFSFFLFKKKREKKKEHPFPVTK